jgi:hypothetical protein
MLRIKIKEMKDYLSRVITEASWNEDLKEGESHLDIQHFKLGTQKERILVSVEQ